MIKRFIFLTTMFFCLNLSTVQATEITDDMAANFYTACLTKDAGQELSKKGQEELCACTANNMQQNMTTEDIQAMGGEDEVAAREVVNLMILKVYAPCMEQPAREYYYNTCFSNPQMKSMSRNPKKTCGCVSDKIAEFLGNSGEKIFTEILERDPNIIDPMDALDSDPAFQSFVSEQISDCVN